MDSADDPGAMSLDENPEENGPSTVDIEVGDEDEETEGAKDEEEEAEEEKEKEDEKGSVFHPPDGGARAWLIALACGFIKLCLFFLQLLLYHQSFWVEMVGAESAESKKWLFGMNTIGYGFVAILMTKYGYRLVGIVGSVIVGVPLFIISWLPVTTAVGITRFLLVITGLGITFLDLTSTVPVLEYFQKKRMRAIVLSGVIVIIPAVLFMLFAGNIVTEWRYNFKIYQVVLMTLTTLACMSLTPLTIEVKVGEKRINRIFGIHSLRLLKDVTFALILLFIFAFWLGNKLGDQSNYTMPRTTDLPEMLTWLLAPLVGLLLGLLVALCIRNTRKGTALLVTGIAIILAAVFLIVISTATNVIVLAVSFCLVGMSAELVNSVTKNVIPDIFGKQNTRIVTGMVMSFTSLAELLSSLSSDLFKDTTTGRYITAGLVTVSSVVAITIFRNILLNRENRKRKSSQIEADPPSANETFQLKEDIACVS